MELGGSWDGTIPPEDQVLAAADAPAAYHNGVRAIIKIARSFTAAEWNAPTSCPEWRAADLAGHLRCIADNYNEYLDDAPVSRLSRLMATGAHPDTIERKFARQNSAELAALPAERPAEHVTAFTESALRYAARLAPLLRLPHHSYRGRVITVAGMAGLAIVEWHVHAWDLASAIGDEYRPDDPQAVLAAWLAGVAQLPLLADADPWLAVLRSSGRMLARARMAGGDGATSREGADRR
jgi:uncharacterized protein (TIGR03083 family)